jgi:S-adenosylmethionine:tRNA ribosyltransferase-isomerase
MPTPPTTSAATRPCSPATPAPWPHPPPRCISTRPCWPRCRRAASQRASVTLHVGAGTFQPVKTENLAEHPCTASGTRCPRPPGRPWPLPRARRPRGGGGHDHRAHARILGAQLHRRRGRCRATPTIFITPGFRFQVVDALLTNFHLPKSTLMMLVSAFAGYEHVMALYRHAIAQRYRFFSHARRMATCSRSTTAWCRRPSSCPWAPTAPSRA